jgi:hypothetical protein
MKYFGFAWEVNRACNKMSAMYGRRYARRQKNV